MALPLDFCVFFVLMRLQSSFLKFVLVRWCLDAVSMSHVLRFTVIWGRVSVSVPETCHLACLLRPFWHLGGPSSDPGGLRTTRGETLGSRPISVDLGGFRDHILRVLGSFWHNKCIFCYACLQIMFFNDFGVCFWMSEAPESRFWC